MTTQTTLKIINWSKQGKTVAEIVGLLREAGETETFDSVRQISQSVLAQK